jgi:small subunit ribosomal protein S9
MVKQKTKKDYTYAAGKRKSASARVRLFRGKGETMINGQLAEKYFPGEINKSVWAKPFRVLDVTDKFYATVKVTGGGLKGQLDATAHAIAKALAKVDKESFRGGLKKARLLTRDARIRQRRMVGTGGKARRKKQSPKR